MTNYQKIAVILVRGLAVSFLVSTMVEVGIIASDVLFVQAGIYPHSEIAFKPRVALTIFYSLASLFLFSQSQMIAKTLVQGLDEETQPEETVNESNEKL